VVLFEVGFAEPTAGDAVAGATTGATGGLVGRLVGSTVGTLLEVGAGAGFSLDGAKPRPLLIGNTFSPVLIGAKALAAGGVLNVLLVVYDDKSIGE